MTTSKFATLPLQKPLLDSLVSMGFERMTPIQELTLPHILVGKDVIAQAKTGSGKTAAFGLGLLSNIDITNSWPQALVLCPTRELATQVTKELRRLASFMPNVKILTVAGGSPLSMQASSLQHGAHVVVGTPGRVQDHLGKRTLVLRSVKTLVLDEADRMLDMGFSDAIREIIAKIPGPRQTLLYSATYPDEIKSISASIQKNPEMVKVEEDAVAPVKIQQLAYRVPQDEKGAIVTTLLNQYRPESTLIFCATKFECKAVADSLRKKGFKATAIHSDLEQRERDETLLVFANRSCSILVATDVAARGLDIKSLDMVIIYDVSRDAEVHVHRIGRTGRAGAKGIAISLVSPAEMYRWQRIEEYLQQKLPLEAAPARSYQENQALVPPMATFRILGGKKAKIRAGDILGALTVGAQVPGNAIGKIDVLDFQSFVAVDRSVAQQAYKQLSNGKIKGRACKISWVSV